MSKFEGQEQGPTWNDVHDASERISARYGLVPVFRTIFYAAGKSTRRTASVVVEGRKTTAPGAEVHAVGVYAFRGNSGAATMPAAMFMALTELEGRLEKREHASAEQARF